MTSGLQLHFIRGEHAHVPIFSSVVPVSARLPHYSAGKVRHPLWAGNTASAWIAADCASPRRVDGRTCAQLPADKSGINRDYTAGGWGFHRPPTRAHTRTYAGDGGASPRTNALLYYAQTHRRVMTTNSCKLSGEEEDRKPRSLQLSHRSQVSVSDHKVHVKTRSDH